MQPKEKTSQEIRQHYEELLTSLDFTFGEIREAAEMALLYGMGDSVKFSKKIIGLIDSRAEY